MKRSLRIFTGIVVLLAFVFGMGMASDGTAWAEGEKKPPVHRNIVPLDKSQLHDMPFDDRETRTSTKNSYIYGATTVNTTTYNSNLIVTSSAYMTVGTNATITINGDLKIAADATVKITSGKLIVNGDIVIENGQLIASGTGQIVVSKAPTTGSVAGKYGGRIIVGDDDGRYAGTLALNGSAKITINYAQYGGLYLLQNSTFKMLSSDTKITVNNDCYFNGYSTKGLLVGGTLEIINGSFQQWFDTSTESFCPNDGFQVIMKGTNNTKRTVFFANPEDSYFTKVSFSGVTFEPFSTISIKTSLATDTTMNLSDCFVFLQGSLNGKKLAITAQATFITSFNALIIDSGSLTINGDFEVDEYCQLIMTNSSGKITVNGSFWTYSNTMTLQNGELLINGDFYQGIDYLYNEDTFAPAQSFVTKISGQDRYVEFESPESSYFTKFSITTDASLDDTSIISIKNDLQNDQTMAYPNLNYRGNLNGHTLQVNGNLTVPAGNTLTVGGGTLNVAGNLTVSGDLVMTEAADKVAVTGNYTASSASASTDLSDGKLFIGGNFAQSGNATSFLATGSHTTVLNGTGVQTVTFGSTSSKFASLVILNDSVDPASIPAQYDSIAMSGTSLKGITASAGTLTPAFGAEVNEYTILLPTGTDSVTITPEFLDRYAGSAWMTEGDGTDHVTSVTVNSVPYDSTKTVVIKAHAAGDAKITDYTFNVMQINPDLSDLGTLPPGAVLEPAFDPSVHTYTVQLPETVASFTFAPQTDHPDSTVHFDTADGPAAVVVALNPYESSTHTVKVVAQDGVTEGSYTVTFVRRYPLSGITVSAGTLDPAFSEGTATYTVNVPTNVPTVTVTAEKLDVMNPDFDWSKFEITADGTTVEADHVDIALAVGETKAVSIKAWDIEGKTSATYTVSLTRVSMLSNIVPSTGTLTPVFNGNIGSYNIYVPNTTASVKLTPAKTQYCTSMTINGKVANDVTLALTAGGKSTATIVCTNGTGAEAFSSTYTVDVYRVAPITGITITGGTLSPTFAVGTMNYTVSVPATTAAVTVTPTVSAYCTNMTMDGQAVASVTLTPAIGGSAATVITGTGLDGVVKTYTITVKRAALITGITPYPGTLSPAFKAATLDYTVTVPYSTTQVKITPVKASTGVKYLYINGVAATYAYIKPPLGGSAKAVIRAIGTDNKTAVAYTVTVKRAGLISAINLSTGSLSPAFVGSTSAYTVNLPITTPSVTITPVKTSSCKSFTINGKAVASAVITPPAGSYATCTIVATALDGTTKSTYTIKVYRHRPITGIGLSTGRMSPTFASTTLDYIVTIPADKPSVTITPTRTTGYSYTINGGSVNTPATINVAPHATETASIVATYPGGSITYTLTIQRADAPDNIVAISGALDPVFSNEVFDYEIHLDHASGPDTVTLNVTATGDCILQTSGLTATKPASPGYKVATITVTPAGELTVTYTIKIYWD